MSDSTTLSGMGNQYQAYNFGNTNPNINGGIDSLGKQTVGLSPYGAPVEAGGTVSGYAQGVPNMQQAAPAPMQDPNLIQPIEGQTLYGFLYSVSRMATGEYWPVYQGETRIGSDPSCDIYLDEFTVSPQHLNLVIRKNRNPEKIVAAVRDLGSAQGTMLNGESLGFDAVECRNGDILTIGQNYELLFILVDTFELGLKPAEKFIPIGTLSPQQAYDVPFMPQMPINMMNNNDLSIPPSFRPNEHQQSGLPSFNPNTGTFGTTPPNSGNGFEGGFSGSTNGGGNNNTGRRGGTQIL